MSAETQPIADVPVVDTPRITSIEIINFRAFDRLVIPSLKRVNLITGRNNAGKSTLLEALFLNADGDWNHAAHRICDVRGEPDYFRTCTHALSQGPSYLRTNRIEMTVSADQAPRPEYPGNFVGTFLIGTQKLDRKSVATLWANVELTPLEDWVAETLQIISPRVVKARLVQGDPHALLKGESKPILLNQLGEGMNRLFGMALALVNCRDGVLLIDEFENGLHYSVQYDIWRMIFQTARRLNVQVFATTHSWDCIEAFTQAALEDEATDGQLIKLGRVGGETVATLFDEESLATITKQHVEVR